MSASAPLTREEFEALPRARLSTPSRLRPTAWRVESRDGPVIVKDAAGAPRGLRWYVRWHVGRERRALERVADLPEAPRVLGRLDADGLVLEMLPGTVLTHERFEETPRAIAEALRRVTKKLHARGVYHLDLHARGNVMVDGRVPVALVDFGAAMVPWRILRPLVGWIFRRIDRHAPLKYLARYAPEALTEDEARQVIRFRRWKRIWFLSSHSPRAERGARRRLAELQSTPISST